MRGFLVLGLTLAGACTLLACGHDAESPAQTASLLPVALDRLPEAAQCSECHPVVVGKWLRHGMADALGEIEVGRTAAAPSKTWVEHAASGLRYRVEADPSGAWILAQELVTLVPGLPPPRREIPLRARIGAGVQDTAFAAVEQGRWFFSPLEFMRGAGWVHAPFQQIGNGSGLNFRITADCLGCHTDAALPHPFPAHDLQDLPLRGISCAACHGDASAHLRRMRGAESVRDGEDFGVLNPSDLPAARQLDLCARCHLEGDALLDLQPPPSAPWKPGEDLLARRAVLVARDPGPQPAFVSQVQRLTLSACFRGSPEMSCTTCHDPHLPPRLQPRERQISACMECHAELQHPSLDAAATTRDCIACHMPQVEPFDLPGARIADHWIRKQPVPIVGSNEFREHESPEGNWETFHYRDGDPSSLTPRGLEFLRAMALAEHDSTAPVADTQTLPTAPDGFPPSALLAQARALAAAGRVEEAITAYEEVLTRDRGQAEAELNRGWLLLGRDQTTEALATAKKLRAAHPRADSPSLLEAAAYSALGQEDSARDALMRSLQSFGAQPLPLQRLGQAALAAGDRAFARRALFGAWSLEPSLPGLVEDLLRARD